MIQKPADALAQLEIAVEIARREAASFLDLVDDVGLIHEVVLAKTEERLQVIRQELAADVDPDAQSARTFMF